MTLTVVPPVRTDMGAETVTPIDTATEAVAETVILRIITNQATTTLAVTVRETLEEVTLLEITITPPETTTDILPETTTIIPQRTTVILPETTTTLPGTMEETTIVIITILHLTVMAVSMVQVTSRYSRQQCRLWPDHQHFLQQRPTLQRFQL